MTINLTLFCSERYFPLLFSSGARASQVPIGAIPKYIGDSGASIGAIPKYIGDLGASIGAIPKYIGDLGASIGVISMFTSDSLSISSKRHWIIGIIFICSIK
ncbi:hypothetical protein ACIQ1H_18430 [Lysinibacillus sp. NPDC097279]|uniref:hypothetical protein n=1 Tax=Lysinibacillus sp. NPDC097279 TaxID=3364143 RepID=UPI00381329D4